MGADIAGYLANQQPSQVVAGASGANGSLVAGQKNLASSYETFLTLLTTQLKNQDPTAPLDTNAFTQQLVQMTGVQQQLLSNQLLQSLVNQGQGGLTEGVGLIGKTVTAQTPSANLDGGSAKWVYDLDTSATEATLSISDASGRIVWSGAAPERGAGEHDFTWNGKDTHGNTLPDGSYTLTVAAKDGLGAKVTSRIFIEGVVDSLSQSNGQTVAKVGATQTPLSAITGVRAS